MRNAYKSLCLAVNTFADGWLSQPDAILSARLCLIAHELKPSATNVGSSCNTARPLNCHCPTLGSWELWTADT